MFGEGFAQLLGAIRTRRYESDAQSGQRRLRLSQLAELRVAVGSPTTTIEDQRDRPGVEERCKRDAFAIETLEGNVGCALTDLQRHDRFGRFGNQLPRLTPPARAARTAQSCGQRDRDRPSPDHAALRADTLAPGIERRIQLVALSTLTMRDIFSLADRVALVTGASQGLGAHMSRVLAAAGAHVVMCARNRDKLAGQAQAIRSAGGRALDLPLDITDEAAVVDAVGRVVHECGGLDVVVNNAGIVARGAAIDSDTDAFRRVLDTNLTAAYVMAREAARPMLERGWGRIINIGSILSLAARATVLSYTTSKHAISGLTRGLAAEFGSGGVNVNALLPGYFRTEINVVLQQDLDFTRWVESGTPAGRWGEAPDLDGPLLFLASDASRYVNGHLLVVDGGMTATL